MVSTFDPTIIAFGLGVGILMGLTGIGGGSLMAPLLILVAGINPSVAIGTDLAYGAVTKTLGGYKHYRKGTVDLGVSKWMAAGSVPGSVLGVVLLDLFLKSSVDTLLAVVAVALTIAAGGILGKTLWAGRAADERTSVVLTTRAKAISVGTGASLGLLLGLTSVGSGALIGPVLIVLFRLTPRRVVGTDVFHAALMMWAAGLAHLVSGNVDFTLMGNILIGSLPGIYVGSQLIDRVPAQILRPTLGCVLLGSAVGVATKAGLDVPSWTVLAVPVAVGAVYALGRVTLPVRDAGAVPA